MAQKKSTNPLVYVGLTLAAVVAVYIAVDTFVLSTKKSSHPELDRGIENYNDKYDK